jgi:SAM-dependent methyltransferase
VEELQILKDARPDGRVFEIGCNDGLFLEQMEGYERLGLEPNSFAVEKARARGLTVINSFLDQSICREAGKHDIVISRQVLEHIPDIQKFFDCVDILLKDDGLLFIDVPNVVPGLVKGDCTIAWEEHVNYFTDTSLLYTLDRFGFVPVRVDRFDYSGGTLAVLARRKTADQPVLRASYKNYVTSFNRRVDEYRNELVHQLTDARGYGYVTVLYGVGCRAAALVNGLNIGHLFDFAVDDQVERQGKFMPGSKLPIHSKTALMWPNQSCMVVLAVNRENEEKVKQQTLKMSPAGKFVFIASK